MSRELTTDSATESHGQPIRPPRKPRNLRPPSARDLQIYKMVKIQRAEQWAVAAKFNLHESRASQIIKNVHRWIAAGGCPTDPDLLDHIARQRISRATHRLRLLRAVELATYAVECESRPLKTTRRRWVGGTEVWCEETTRPQPEVNLSAVRALLNAAKALQDFEAEDQLSTPDGSTSSETEPDLLPAVFSLLCTWRTHAEAAGRLSPAENIQSLVASLLNNLLGSHITAPPNSTDESSTTDVPPPTNSALNLSAAPSDPLALNSNAQVPCVNWPHPSPKKML